jgi:small-conductance mechanosensitive channel
LTVRALLSALVLLATLGLATAQDPGPRAALETQRALLDRVEQQIARPGLDQQTLQELRGELDPAIEALRELAIQLEPAKRAAEERLTQLGDKPEAPATEPPEISRQRAEIEAQVAAADADLRQARLLSVRADQLSERLAQRRRDLFSRELFQRSSSVIDPTLWRDVGNAMPRIGLNLGFFVQDWFAVLGSSRNALGFVVLALTVLLAVVVYWPLRKRLLGLPYGRLFDWGSVERPTAVQRSIVAAWTAVVNALLPAAAAFIVVEVLERLSLLPARFGPVADGVVLAFVAYSSLTAVAYALLAPDRPAWRFLPLSDRVARRAMRTAHGVGLVAAIFLVVHQVLGAITTPLVATVAVHGVRGLVFGAVLAYGLAAVAAAESAEREERAKDPYAAPSPRGAAWRWLRLVLWAGALAVPAAAIAGYSAFATFLSWQIVWALIVLGALVVLVHLIDDGLSELARAGSKGGRRMARTFGIEESSVEQLGILASGVARVALIVLAGFLVIAPWGVESRDALGWMRAAFFGVQVGGITISLSAVLLALTIFVLGLVATSSVQRWLDEKLLPSTRMDIGLRNSIRTGVGYVGFVIAGLIGFTYLGVDVSNLAIVAGALSVGIGFGLQSIVSNFVSGLILLAERPIKAGDWIVASGAEGYVKRINVRATEIETFDNAVLIVPNSTLIGGTVKNWMHNDLTGKATIRVGVPHGTDVDKVRDLLVAIAKEHELVDCTSEPKAQLVEFTDLGMYFELGCTVMNVDKSGRVKSDIRYEIARRFQAEGIPIK